MSVLSIAAFFGSFLSVSSDYVAAIAQHDIFFGQATDSPSYLLDQNLKLYEEFIQLARKQNADVLVFPEFGVTPVDSSDRGDLYAYAEKIPDVSDSVQVTPCSDPTFSDKPILARISCASQSAKLLTLVNMIDWVDCDSSDSSCPSDGRYLYNTDVLFDESGQLVRKYHKSHEWPGLIQAGYDQPPTPSHVTYRSSFGVEFGLFICYDIMFQDPPKVLRSQGIQHFLYAVKQGDAGEKTLITQWSKSNQATLVSANLGAGATPVGGDCSGVIVNGTTLLFNKYHLKNSAFPEENLLVSTVPS